MRFFANFLDSRLPDRHWKKLVPCPMSGCWLWLGATGKTEYGHVWNGHRYTTAHRHVFRALIGDVPDDLDLDHLCRNSLCCNPAHLEPVTHAENLRRCGAQLKAAAAAAAARRAETHCKNGHEYTPQNTRSYAGYRCCRKCHADIERARRAARSSARRAMETTS